MTVFPKNLEPMLATLVKKPFNDEDWLYEVKRDGYRIIAYVEKGKVTLHSRALQNYTKRYQTVADALKEIKYDAVFDGEIVVLDRNGHPHFNLLQNYKPGDPVVYYIFDLIYYKNKSLLNSPLVERKALLNDILETNNIIQFSSSFEDGLQLYEKMKELEMEGIVAKNKDSLYFPGERVKTWLKIPIKKMQEYVIAGWTESGSGRLFRSLLVGNFENGKLNYVHHAGGGFNDKQMKELIGRLRKLEIKKRPFANKIETSTKPHWVKPVLVGQFEQSTKTTPTGKIRHPLIFKWLRDDKKAEMVEPEITTDVEKAVKGGRKNLDKLKQPKTAAFKKEEGAETWEDVENRPVISKEEIQIEGRELELVNIDKELWSGVTKADLIQYYISIAPYILPYLRNRPLALHVNLKGPYANGFFLRGLEGHYPNWAEVFTTERKHKKNGKSDKIEWLVCNDLATLVYIINMKCIDIHPWASRISSPNFPDYIGIDLDPSDDDFFKVIQTAKTAKQLLDKHGIKAFPKTSGKTGMHLYSL